MIEVKNLNKKFGRLEVLKSVSLSFSKGISYALIGPNGSGKTTLIKSILGLVIPDSGTINVNGKSISGDWKYRDYIGYMPQIGRYPDNMTIGHLFDMIRDLRSAYKSADEDLIREFKLNNMLNKRMRTLSGGTRQKVSAALAFMFCPPVLILDEPTAGLDPIAVEIMKEKIQYEMKGDQLFLITSHILSDLDDLSSHVTYLEDGQIMYNDTIVRLKDESGEIKLGKAIASIMKKQNRELEAV